MLLIALIACNNALDADDVRRQLDAPTARLTAATLPQVADDLVMSQRTVASERAAMGLQSGGSRSSTARSAVDGFLGGGGALGTFGCAVGTAASIQSNECVRGQTCRTRFTFKSCLLDDPLADGKIRFTVEERERRDYDEGRLTVDFRGWQTSADENSVYRTDGEIEVEARTWPNKEEIVYTADFASSVRDAGVRGDEGIQELVEVMAALRITSEDTAEGEDVSVEVLGWVDEDGDGVQDGSVVLRMSASIFDEGDALQTTLELVDAAGTWTCTYSVEEEQTSDGVVWTSQGSCTDPSGAPVDFEGVVGR